MDLRKWFGGRQDEDESTYQEYSAQHHEGRLSSSITTSKLGRLQAVAAMITKAIATEEWELQADDQVRFLERAVRRTAKPIGP